MKELKAGHKAPAFKLAAILPASASSNSEDEQQWVSLADFKGTAVVLYFYPKDNTPGCTTESDDFNTQLTRFKRAKVQILGISRDSLKSHVKFRDKLSLKFPLLSDEDSKVCRKYDVLKWKKLYGKEYEGIERSTFLIDADGVIQQIWRKVKVPGHVDEVLAAAKAL